MTSGYFGDEGPSTPRATMEKERIQHEIEMARASNRLLPVGLERQVIVEVAAQRDKLVAEFVELLRKVDLNPTRYARIRSLLEDIVVEP